MAFPVTPRYFLNFRNSDTGLTPTFVFFKRADTFANITPPSITELSNGEYFFDWTWATKTDPDIVFEVDGGASIPTEEVRFIKGTISPRDRYLDSPTSDVLTDLATIKGGGFNPVTDSLEAISDAVAGISPAIIADAIWDEATAGHVTAGTTGKKLVDGSTSADVTAAQVSIKGAGNVDNTQLTNKLGTPAGASVSADIAAIKAETATINTNTSTLGTRLTRALGLMHENSVLDQTVFDGSNNLTNGRLRIYDSKANALAAGATGLLNTYTITATYIGDNVQTYTVVLEP